MNLTELITALKSESPAVAALADFKPAVIAAGHCTGWRATVAMANAFGAGVLAPLAVGKRFTF